MAVPLSPHLSPLQRETSSRGGHPPVPATCVVTGGTGFVGMRLVEMLVERGARKVIAFDIVPRDKVPFSWDHPAIEYVVGDVTDAAAVDAAVEGADCVWHLAAAVGPFHPQAVYAKINHGGTLNVIASCKRFGVAKLVMSSSPSTRFQGSFWRRPDVDGLTEAQLPALPLPAYMATYAETKALGELAAAAACSDSFFSVSVAPHQVYGPRDNLFMPNTLEAAGTGALRVLGGGANRICMTYVDNYCHGLIIAERRLFRGSPQLGRFYICTDGRTHPNPRGFCVFWAELDSVIAAMGFPRLAGKARVPFLAAYVAALCCDAVGWLLGRVVFKLNVFSVYMLTMHRWFDTAAAEAELGYAPVVAFADGWADTAAWFRQHWLPGFLARRAGASVVGIAAQTQGKIDIHDGAVSRNGRAN
jgi:nucleoside-diphosphate-sugar epimerase